MGNLDRIRRVSRALRVYCTVAIALTPPGLAALWVTFDAWAPGLPAVTRYGPFPTPMPAGTLLLAFAVTMLPGGVAMWGFGRLRRLFGLYAVGTIFAAENARCLRGFAVSVIVLALLEPVARALLSVVLSMHNPPGQRVLELSIGWSQVPTLFLGLVLLVIAWIMDEGRVMAEDQAQIV